MQPLALMDWPAMVPNCVDCGGGSSDGGTGRFVTKGAAKDGVQWLVPDGSRADNGSARRLWPPGRQRPCAATMEFVDLQ